MRELVIAAITYKRPDLLTALLDSLANMRQPDGVRVRFLVVDNDHAKSAERAAQRSIWAKGDLVYLHEPKKGIPVARNRALNAALDADADVLCFVDDDETVDANWLTALLSGSSGNGTPPQMIGGPVLVSALQDHAMSNWQKLIHQSLVARGKNKARRAANTSKSGGRFAVVTNNWLADLTWVSKHGLRFDEENFRFSGGSDTDFFRAFERTGGVARWEPEAVVYETIPKERLSLRYQLERGRAQSSNHFRMKHKRVTFGKGVVTLLLATVRMISGSVLLVVPIMGVASPVVAVRSIGWGLGRIDALLGSTANLYGQANTD